MTVVEDEIKPGMTLEGPFWPGPVQVVSFRSYGDSFELGIVESKTSKYSKQMLSRADLAKIKISELTERTFRGDPERFFLAVESYRIRFAYQFDPLYAVNVSQINPLPHQIEAVYHYIIPQSRIRFLLADDPGAGKTVMAGLVLRELKQRGLVDNTLIVVPGQLTFQWKRELREKFTETFNTIDRAVMEASWGQNVWQETAQAITSMDFAKQEDVLRGLSEVHWNLVIIDEAHKMAAYQYGEKIKKVQRYKLGEVLSRNSDFLLLLTATPHRGDPDNFRLFLDLLEPGFFANTEMLNESVRNKDNPLFLRRLKEDLTDFDKTPLFPPRKVETLKCRLSDKELNLYNQVTEYFERYYKKAVDNQKRNVAFALIILQRRLASSVRACRITLERRKEKLQELVEQGMILQESRRSENNHAFDEFEDELEDEDEQDRWKKEDEMVAKLTSAQTITELQEEIAKLDELTRLAKDVERQETETKLTRLKEVIESDALRDGSKLLIFTESKDTLEYLVQKIREWKYTVTYIHGGLGNDRRIAAEQEFRNAAQIMVSTEAGGEGINLQFCHLMVNYDIPWNPNRLEQRMGRVHRYGQRYEVHIYNLIATQTREGKILEKLFQKLDNIRDSLGSDRVFDVIGDLLPGKSLKDLIVDALSNERTMDEILKDFDRTPDQELIRRVKEATMEGLATRNIDFTRILGEERIAKENRLVPEYIERFFMLAAKKLEIPYDRRTDGFYRISTVPYELRRNSLDFKIKYGEVGKQYEKFGFEKSMTFKESAEFFAPGHPMLESVVESILEKYRRDLELGSTFADPSGVYNGVVWFIEGQINDGTNMPAGKRIFCVYESFSGELRQISSSLLWDLKPISLEVEPDLLSFGKSEDKVKRFSLEKVLPFYLQEIQTKRDHDAGIKRKYGVRSLSLQILESEEKLLRYEEQRHKGVNVPEASSVNEQRKKEDLLRKKSNLEREIEAETHLLPSSPKILGAVIVIPQQAHEESMERDPEIERMGMLTAIKFEELSGRLPEDVSSQNLGFDIRSKIGEANYRYIEVKARAKTGNIALTPNEWLMANRLRDQFWIYIVENAGSNPTLWILNNPADKIKPDQRVEIVRYIVNDWKDVSAKAEI
jgi:superfamily II DNA or RNA helicase